MILLILVPISLIILNIWLWLFDNIFQLENNKLKIITITIAMWLISWLSIIMFPKIVSYLGYFNLDFTQQTDNFKQQIRYFGIYLSCLIIFFKLIISKFRFSKELLINFILFSLLFIVIWFLWQNSITETALKYYIFVALWEEFVKFFLWISFYEKYKITDSDIIIFSILSALWFAFIENFVYVFTALNNYNWILQGIFWWISILISRWLIWFIVHTIFTWNIWLLNLKWLKSNFIIWASIGIVLGVGLHYTYNLLLHNWYKSAILWALFIGYFWISFLFYNSDRIFVKEWIKYVYY